MKYYHYFWGEENGKGIWTREEVCKEAAILLLNHTAHRNPCKCVNVPGYYALSFGGVEVVQEEVTRTWKVYGMLGHRQRESFLPSREYDFTRGAYARPVKLEVLNADVTGTNEYSVVRITAPNAEECERELNGQLSDGVFENSRVGRVEEVLK